MKYRVITSFSTSSKFYSNTPTLPLRGTGQEPSASGGNYLFTRVPMRELLSKICSCCHVINRDKKIIWNKHILGLVDDARQYASDCNTDQIQVILKHLTKVSQIWEQLHSTSGGKLEISKCAVYTMQWKFYSQGISYLDNNSKDTITMSLSQTNIH